MLEQQKRYAKYHDTAYNLEPNIKEGPGGLRDLQVISWVFKRHYNASSLRELIKYGFLPKSEYDNLITARDILWRLRFALHNLTNRCEDRLVFDYQRELASQFGYVDRNEQPDVEQFMQFYFKTVVDIERLNEMLLQLLNERLISNKESLTPIPITANFSSIDGYLEVSNKDVFQKQPLALLEIPDPAAIAVAQRHSRQHDPADQKKFAADRRKLSPQQTGQPVVHGHPTPAARHHQPVETDEPLRRTGSLFAGLRQYRGPDAIRPVPYLHSGRTHAIRDPQSTPLLAGQAQ
nr:hypothetical protein [Methylomonas koyamae]